MISRITIRRTVNNGPISLEHEIDGEGQDVLVNLANMGVAIDQAKALVVALGGTVQKINIITAVV